MRVWLDPNKVAARGLTASDVVTAMQEQTSVFAGQLGAEPLPQESDFLISINAGAVCIPKKSLAISF